MAFNDDIWIWTDEELKQAIEDYGCVAEELSEEAKGRSEYWAGHSRKVFLVKSSKNEIRTYGTVSINTAGIPCYSDFGFIEDLRYMQGITSSFIVRHPDYTPTK